MRAIRLPASDFLGSASVARGLLGGDERLRDLVTHDPADPGALLSSARAAAEREIDREALVASLVAGLSELGAPEAAHLAAARLLEPGTVVVVTGQQPGLLGGPLMVLVKALAAAAIARHLESQGIAAVPVFWHASEDHDHAEADHVGWLAGGALERLRLPLPEDGRVLAAVEVPLGPAADLVQRVLSELPDGAGRDVLGELLPPDSAESLSFGAWTGRLVARILGAQGIVVVEPHRLRTAAAAVARHELQQPGALHAGLLRAQERVTAAGFSAPLALRRPELLFHVDPSTGARQRVAVEGDRVEVNGETAPVATWLDRLASDPTLFSWNVAARVLAQDVALPVAAQVCGPAELGYVSLLREGHAELGIPQPLAVLRPGVTLVDRGARRACKRLGIAAVDVVKRGAAAIPDPPLEGADALELLGEALDALPPGRSPGSKRRRAELTRQAELFEEALRRDAADADGVRATRKSAVLSALLPFDRPMERALSFLPWYARGGDAFVTALLESLGTGEPGHLVVATEDL